MSLAPPQPSKLVPGYRLGRYELLCPIAEGGMAEVWVARLQGKHGFEKLVAVKTILAKYASDLRFQQMFLDEARIASRIEHTNVAHIVDLGDDSEILYLVMEWVDGDAFAKIYRSVEKKSIKIPHGVLLRVLADTCGGLHAAHELRGADGVPLGVVHRDVSPQNILISSRGVAKLIDFGVAKARDRVAGDTSTGFLKGKIQYMAPEQALGKAIDGRADVWAIGAILYHYLAGKPAFDGPNQLATLHLLTSGRPPVPLPPSVPPAVVSVVKRALTHDPAQRFASAAEMQSAIEAAMIESKLVTSTSDVAAFTSEHVADRAKQRKDAIDLALKAAAERARVQALLKPPSAESSSGIPDAAAKVGLVELSPVSPSSMPPDGVPSHDWNPTVPGVPRMPVDANPAARKPLSDQSSATLGSAAIVTPITDGLPAVASRRRIAFAAIACVGVIAMIAIVATVAFRAGRSTAGVANESPSAATTQRPPASSASAATQPTATAIAGATKSAATESDSATAPSATTAPPTPATPPVAVKSTKQSTPTGAATGTGGTKTTKIPTVIPNGF